MPVTAALIAGGASIIGGSMSRSGQASANRQNLKIARENRAWQEQMSNTAYQRATKDLEAAGLNRILAMGSPATTPGGNVATMQNVAAQQGQQIGEAGAKAMSAKMVAQQIRNMRAQETLTLAQAQAIQPAAQAGGAVGTAIDTAKQRLKPLDYGSMADRLWTDTKAVYNKLAGMTSQRKTLPAEQRIANAAKSVGLNPDKAKQQVLRTVRQMDLPKMTDEQAYRWAVANPEKLREFEERQKRMGM